MGLALVEVQVERPFGIQQAVDLAQPRLEEPEVVVEAVAVGRALEQLGAVAAAAESGAVAGLRRASRASSSGSAPGPVLNGGSA